MGNSLQDQLLNAGLIDKKRAEKVKKQKRKQVQQKKPKAKTTPPSPEELQRKKEEDEKRARDRELNLKREEVRKQREVAFEIKQLVKNNRHPLGNADNDIPFHFENKGKIKKIYVSKATHEMVSAGQLVIVNCNGIFELVPSDIAEKIRKRNPSLVFDLPKEQKADEDDPYSEFQVPDDLVW